MEALAILESVFDALLALGLLWLAWRALASPDLFKAIVLFITFGLLMALAWVRLHAPDIALAEAAIGAGLTGALLLAALAKLRQQLPDDEDSEARDVIKPGPWLSRWPALILTTSLAAGLGYVVWSLPATAPGLSPLISDHLALSGVSNPVTAVLLNFRGYDTLLEMLVLLLALLGVWSVGGTAQFGSRATGAVLDVFARQLTPLLILIAAYLLWVGAHAPGGAFQAGSLLGAAGVLLLLAGWRLPQRLSGVALRCLLVLGPAAFVIIAALTLLLSGQMLTFSPAHAGNMILVLEALATLSIGAILAGLFLGADPDVRRHP